MQTISIIHFLDPTMNGIENISGKADLPGRLKADLHWLFWHDVYVWRFRHQHKLFPREAQWRSGFNNRNFPIFQTIRSQGSHQLILVCQMKMLMFWSGKKRCLSLQSKAQTPKDNKNTNIKVTVKVSFKGIT